MKQADALSFEQALALVPDEFHPYAMINSFEEGPICFSYV